MIRIILAILFIIFNSASASQCEGDALNNELDILEQTMTSISNSDWQPVYKNIEANDCSSLFDKGTGLKNFSHLVQDSIQQGIKCLNGLGVQSQKDSSGLLNILNDQTKTARIFCGKYKQKTTFGDQGEVPAGSAYSVTKGMDSPGIILNLSFMDASEKGFKRTIFHEMLHWLGYEHDKTFDVPYLSDFCCFEALANDPDGHYKQMACDLIKNRPEKDSPEYVIAFSKIMLLDGNDHIVFSGINSSLANKDNPMRFSAMANNLLELTKELPDEIEMIYLQAIAPSLESNLRTKVEKKMADIKIEDEKTLFIINSYAKIYRSFFTNDTDLRDKTLLEIEEKNRKDSWIYNKCDWMEMTKRQLIHDNAIYFQFKLDSFIDKNKQYSKSFKNLCQGF